MRYNTVKDFNMDWKAECSQSSELSKRYET